MRRFLILLFLAISTSTFAQHLLQKDIAYFSTDTLINVELSRFQKIIWESALAGELQVYYRIPLESDVPIDYKVLAQHLTYSLVMDPWNLMDEVSPNQPLKYSDVTFLRSEGTGENQWISSVFSQNGAEVNAFFFTMESVKPFVDDELMEYVSNALSGTKTTWTSYEDYDLSEYNYYTNSMSTLMEWVTEKAIAAKIQPWDTRCFIEPVSNLEIQNAYKENITFYDIESFEEEDSLFAYSFPDKFYGLQLHPTYEVTHAGIQKKSNGEFASLLFRLINMEPYFHYSVFSFKISEAEQQLSLNEKIIWKEFLDKKPSAVACYPQSYIWINAAQSEERTALAQLAQRLTDEAKAGKLSAMSYGLYDEETKLTPEEIVARLQFRYEAEVYIDSTDEIKLLYQDVPVEPDSLKGFGIRQYWKPANKPGDFYIYRWEICPHYPSFINEDMVTGYPTFYVDGNNLLALLGSEGLPLRKLIEERMRTETDVFEFESTADGYYFFKREKNGEKVSIVNCEPAVKKGDRYEFTYQYANSAYDAEYRTLYAVRRSKL